MGLTDAAMVCLVVLAVAVLGAWSARRSARLAVGVVAALSVWLGVVALLASTGVLASSPARPPRLPFVVWPPLIAAALLGRTQTARAMVARTPLAWPVAAQTFRVGVELVLFAYHRIGRVPVQMTFEGRNVDMLVGLTAPVLAFWVARRRTAPGVVVTWNVLGMTLLMNTLFTAVTSAPGPLHRDWPGGPFTTGLTWPLVWLPSFLVPLAITLHVVSLRQSVPLLRSSSNSIEKQPS